MRNVTITLDDETARWARMEAARRETSVSRLVGEMLRSHMDDEAAYERAHRSYMARSPAPLRPVGTKYPSRDSLYER